MTESHTGDPLAGMPQGESDASKAPTNDRRNLYGLMLGALGVVFGDIGTSPLYALRAT